MNNSRYNNYYTYTHDKNCQHYRTKYICYNEKTIISMPIMYNIFNFHSIHKVKLFFEFFSQNTCINKANIDQKQIF